MEDNFTTLIRFVYNFLANTTFTAFNITLSLLDVCIGMFLLGLVWFALDKIFD